MEAKPLDAGQFKAGMRSLAGAVNIITSAHAGHRYGMTATAVCSASAEPPTVLVCINKLATTHGNWTRLATGSPALVEALVSFDCRVVKKMTHGSHTVFLGLVEQMLLGQKGKPLLYSEGQYAKLASLTIGEPLPEGLDYWGFYAWIAGSASSSRRT